MTPEQQLIEGVLRGAVGHYNLVDLHALCKQAEDALAAYRASLASNPQPKGTTPSFGGSSTPMQTAKPLGDMARDGLTSHAAPTQAPAPVEALREMEARKDAAYEERNRCVALIARMAVAMGRDVRVTRTAIEGWSDDWHGCIYIDLPTGQASWHFHDSQAHLFAGLPTGDATWDGHDTPEKYRRVDAAYAGDYECPGQHGDDPRGCGRVRCQLGARCVQAPAVQHGKEQP